MTVVSNSIKGHREVKAGGVATQPTLNTAHWHKVKWICTTFGFELCERSTLHTFSFLLKQGEKYEGISSDPLRANKATSPTRSQWLPVWNSISQAELKGAGHPEIPSVGAQEHHSSKISTQWVFLCSTGLESNTVTGLFFVLFFNGLYNFMTVKMNK